MRAGLPSTIGTLGAALIISLGAWAPGAIAQSEGAVPEHAPGLEQSPTEEHMGVSQHELKTFANATREVTRIDADYQPRIESATTPEERQDVEDEAMGRMVEAVENEGMTVEEYNHIAILAELDPVVAQRIVDYVRQGG